MAEPKAVKFLGPDAEITPTRFLGPDVPLSPAEATSTLESLGMADKPPDERTMFQRAAQGAVQNVGEQFGPAAGMAARVVIPQNEAELGMLAGTLGAQGLVGKLGLTGMKAAGTRIAGGALGGEAGGEYMGATQAWAGRQGR